MSFQFELILLCSCVARASSEDRCSWFYQVHSVARQCGLSGFKGQQMIQNSIFPYFSLCGFVRIGVQLSLSDTRMSFLDLSPGGCECSQGDSRRKRTGKARPQIQRGRRSAHRLQSGAQRLQPGRSGIRPKVTGESRGLESGHSNFNDSSIILICESPCVSMEIFRALQA